MVSTIMQALNAGYKSKTILNYIKSKFPQHAATINNALNAGFAAESIIRYLTREDTEAGPMTEQEQARRKQKAGKQKTLAGLAGTLGAVGAAGAGLYNLYKSSQAIRPSAILPPLPSQPQLPPPGQRLGLPGPSTQARIGNVPTQPITPVPGTIPTPPIAPAQAAKAAAAPTQAAIPPTAAQTTQQPAAQTPQTAQQAIQAMGAPEVSEIAQTAVDTFKNTGQIDRIYNLVEGGTKESDIPSILRKTAPKEVIKEFEKLPGGYDKAVQDVVSYAKANPRPARDISTMGEKIEPKVEGIKPQSQVITSTGDLGTIESIKGNVAKVNIDGKTHTKKVSDLVESPASEKDMADILDDLIAKIESETGEEVSKFINLASYDADTGTLFVHPYASEKTYSGKITPEEAENLTKLMRQTSGESFIGPWEKGTESPIGAAISKIFQRWLKEKRGREKAELAQQKFKFVEEMEPLKPEGAKVVYHAYGPAEKLKKQKYQEAKAKEREAIKAEKKKAKDEAKPKKRKKPG